MNKATKIQKIAAALDRRGAIKREEGETDTQFVTRVITARVNDFKENLLKSLLTEQINFETPKVEVDVSDL